MPEPSCWGSGLCFTALRLLERSKHHVCLEGCSTVQWGSASPLRGTGTESRRGSPHPTLGEGQSAWQEHLAGARQLLGEDCQTVNDLIGEDGSVRSGLLVLFLCGVSGLLGEDL